MNTEGDGKKKEGMVEAALAGNLRQIQECLEQGQDIDAQNRLGQTALHHAALAGSAESARWLLDRGAKVNLATHAGTTALQFAARNGSADCVDLLLQKGADMHKKNILGKSAIHVAIEKGQYKVVELLLNAGANSNDEDLRGRTCLHIAVEKGDKGIAELLLRKGASTIASAEGDGDEDVTPFDLCRRFQNDPMMKLLESWRHRKTDHDKQKEDRAEADRQSKKRQMRELFLAAWAGDGHAIENLLNKGLPADAKDGHGNTPLHECVEHGHTNCADTLISRGASIHDKDVKGNTALHLACAELQANCVDLLLDKGARVCERNSAGETALHMAVQHKIEGGKAVRTDGVIRKATSVAPQAGMLSRLPSLGSLEHLDRLSRKPGGSYENLAKLEQVIAMHGLPLVSQLPVSRPLSLTSPASFHSPDKQRRPSLADAAALSMDRIVASLLNYGADPADKDWRGLTALAIATERGHVGSLELMLFDSNVPAALDAEHKKAQFTQTIEYARQVGKLDLAETITQWMNDWIHNPPRASGEDGSGGEMTPPTPYRTPGVLLSEIKRSTAPSGPKQDQKAPPLPPPYQAPESAADALRMQNTDAAPSATAASPEPQVPVPDAAPAPASGSSSPVSVTPKNEPFLPLIDEGLGPRVHTPLPHQRTSTAPPTPQLSSKATPPQTLSPPNEPAKLPLQSSSKVLKRWPPPMPGIDENATDHAAAPASPAPTNAKLPAPAQQELSRSPARQRWAPPVQKRVAEPSWKSARQLTRSASAASSSTCGPDSPPVSSTLAAGPSTMPGPSWRQLRRGSTPTMSVMQAGVAHDSPQEGPLQAKESPASFSELMSLWKGKQKTPALQKAQ